MTATWIPASIMSLQWVLGAVAMLITTFLWPGSKVWLLRIGPLAVTLAIIALWANALLSTASQQPPAYMLKDIPIDKNARSVVLGHDELMQNPGLGGSADSQHVQLTRDSGGWAISNVSSQRRLQLEYADIAERKKTIEFDSSMVPLRPGDRLSLSGAASPWQIDFKMSASNRLNIDVTGGNPRTQRSYEISWSAGALTIQSGLQALSSCDGSTATLLNRAKLIYSATKDKQEPITIVHIGGHLECMGEKTAAIAVSGTTFDAVSLAVIQGVGFGLRQGSEPSARLTRGNTEIWLSRPAQRLEFEWGGRIYQLHKFVAGYTKYSIEHKPERLALNILPAERSQRVMGKRTCFDAMKDVEPKGLGQTFRPRCVTAPSTEETWAAPGESMSTMLRATGRLARWWVAALTSQWIWLVVSGCICLSVVGARVRWLRRKGTANAFRHDLVRLTDAQSVKEIFVRVCLIVAAIVLATGFFAWQKGTGNLNSATPIVPWPSLVAWALAAVAVATARGSSLLDGSIMSAWTGLLALGHVALTSLTVTSGELRTLRFADDTTTTIGLMATVVIAASQVSPRWFAERVRALTVAAGALKVSRGMMVCLGLLVVLLAAWFVFGSEAGIAGAFQPSELIKTVTIVLLAAAVTTALERDRGPEGSLAEFWVSLVIIGLVLLVTLAVPIIQHDLSPFLILIFTAMLTFLFVIVLHWTAIGMEHLTLSNPYRAPPPDMRLRRRSETKVGRVRRKAGNGLKALRKWILRPEVLILTLFVTVVAVIGSFGAAMLKDGGGYRDGMMEYVGVQRLTKPVTRVISWLEFNATQGNEALAIEFPDVGLQVSSSRKAIAASRCRTLTGPPTTAVESESRNALMMFEHALATISEWAAERFLSSCTSPQLLDSAAMAVAKKMPAIQNDFISTWLMARYGRDGAVSIVILQCLLLTLMMLAGFLAIKWSPGQLYDRPAAAVAGFATIGFAVTLGLQWVISWQNALGLLPVMGQPSTFFSHGPSHQLLFGLPAVLAAIVALRMRSAFRAPAPPRRPQIPWWYVRPRWR